MPSKNERCLWLRKKKKRRKWFHLLYMFCMCESQATVWMWNRIWSTTNGTSDFLLYIHIFKVCFMNIVDFFSINLWKLFQYGLYSHHKSMEFENHLFKYCVLMAPYMMNEQFGKVKHSFFLVVVVVVSFDVSTNP